MENKLSVKGMYISVGICIFMISLIFHLSIYIVTRDILLILSVFIYMIAIISCIAVLLILLRRKISLFSSQLCGTIEDMINGSENILTFLEEETLLSRIHHRLQRLYKIMQESRHRENIERMDLQELISDISHQVKTPIANLKMINTTLQNRTMTSEEQKSFLQATDQQLNKLDFLMSSLIKTSRLESGIITLMEKPCPIYETIALALSDIYLLAEKKSLDITVKCNPDLIVYHDVKWTSEALFNILDNAVKYTDIRGSIQITVECWEMYTKIDIKDNGRGIAENQYTKIFKRFYREVDVHHIDGIGIGLYLARKIITMQGGYITVISEDGNGSIFSIFLLNNKSNH